MCGGQGRDEWTVRMTRWMSVKTGQGAADDQCVSGGRGGGRTLLEVGCVKPTEGGNLKIPVRWAETRVGVRDLSSHRTPLGVREGALRPSPLPPSWFIRL